MPASHTPIQTAGDFAELIDHETLAMVAEATDRATVGRLLRIFVDDTIRRLDRLDGLVASGKRLLLADEAHALKGSAASMGAAAIATAAFELEHRAKRDGGDLAAPVAALRVIAERSYPGLLGWSEQPEQPS
jgi:HPt (histidine-containing phosphotransfer) domain-containing protein